jgi:hypothetical protein
MGFVRIPLIPRTTRPSVAGTPVWYAEATIARTQLDINIAIPTGPSRKLILFWGSDGGEFPTAVTFDPTGVSFPMIPIDGAFGELGNLRVAAWYLDTPPEGAKVVRIATTNAVWSAASLKVYQDARAGTPAATALEVASGNSAVILLNDEFLLDAFSETIDMVVASGLSEGGLTPLTGQTAGADDVVNSSFLATTSRGVHDNNGSVHAGWTAAAPADMLLSVVNVLFSTGQVAAESAVAIHEWNLDESSGSFLDAHGRSNAGVVSGPFSANHAPLFVGGGTSISIQGTKITAANHVDAQVRSWSAEVYFQPRALPAAGTNDAVLSKDSGLPVPGGFQIEYYNDSGTGRARAYIRDEIGTGGTAIWVTPDTPANVGAGTLAPNVAHRLVLTYDDPSKTAKLYHQAAGGSVTLLAERTASASPSFSGLEQNASVFSLFSRSSSTGNEIDGIADRVTFFSGVLTQAEIEARPAPTTIADPGPPTGIVMQNIVLGTLAPSTNTDVDPKLNGSGFGSGNLDLTEVSDPAGRMSFTGDGTPTAKIRITTPPAPATPTNEQATATISEAGGPASNVFQISWTREAAGGGGYTPFDFVTTDMPALNHNGAASRPGYSPTDPPSASIVDPMSGLELFRIGGNNGSTLFINGTQNSGLVFPRRLRQQNNTKTMQNWNSDGTLLMISRRYSVSGDASPAAGSYLIDVDGSHGASAPWRILRAHSTTDLGDGVGVHWFWDLLNPLRAYVILGAGLYEWWPIGGSGHSEGDLNQLRTWPSGYSFTGVARYGMFSSRNGRWHVLGARRNDGVWGGFRLDLIDLTLGSFIANPNSINDHQDRAIYGVSSDGLYGYTSPPIDEPVWTKSAYYNMSNGQRIGDDMGSSFIVSHGDAIEIDGVQYWVNREGPPGHNLFRISNQTLTSKTNFHGSNPQHSGCRAHLDTYERHGATGGSTSGQRYGLWCRSSTSGGVRRGIMAIRLGADDFNVVRYLCNHRSVRTTNANEVHPMASPDFEYVVFNSNWEEPGVATDGDVHPYICVVPDAFHSPNNNGS